MTDDLPEHHLQRTDRKWTGLWIRWPRVSQVETLRGASRSRTRAAPSLPPEALSHRTCVSKNRSWGHSRTVTILSNITTDE